MSLHGEFIWPGATIPLPASSEKLRKEHRCVHVPPFVLNAGDVLIVTAGSGVGKSFFASLLSGNANLSAIPEAKTRRILAKMPRPRPAIVVPQTPSMRMDLSVKEEVMLTWQAHLASTSRYRPKELAERFEGMIKRFGLGEQASTQMSKLSGGQLKRVGLLMRLAEPAPFIILDEPDSGVDQENAENILESLFEMPGEPTTFIVVTHHSKIVQAAGASRHITEVKLEKSYREDLSALAAKTKAPRASQKKSPYSTRLTGLPSAFGAAARLSLEALLPKFSDFLFNCVLALAVYGLVAVGTDVSSSSIAGTRFPKHAFFAIIASLWMGLQFSAHATMQTWESWRADAVWRSGLRGVDAAEDCALTSALFLWSLMSSALIGCGLRTLVGLLAILWVGQTNGWLTLHGELPVEAAFDLFIVCLLASIYGSLWGILLAAGVSSVDTHLLNRQPKQFWLQLTIPLVLLAHLIFSTRFLDKDPLNVLRMTCETWMDYATRQLPSNILASVTEQYRIDSPRSSLNLQVFREVLLYSFALLALCWLALTTLLSSKDIREK